MRAFLTSYVRLMGAVHAGIGASYLSIRPFGSLLLGIAAAAAACWVSFVLDGSTVIRHAVVRGYLAPLAVVTALNLTWTVPDSWTTASHFVVLLVTEVFVSTPGWVWCAAVAFGAYRAHTASPRNNPQTIYR